MVTSWQDALDWLYGLANWETRPPGAEVTFELDRIRAVLAELGDPHVGWPAVHVAGTNGKGSTCALVASALQAAGYRVGLFTSPHLHTVRERIRVDGLPIGERQALAWLDRHAERVARHAGLTTFEALTALAFDHFARCEVDVGVIEVGLGGRLDTTNVVRPAVCVLTPIGLDHTRVLGDTIAQIAADKAGIIKPGVPVVTAPQDPEAYRVIRSAAENAGARLVSVGRDVTWIPRGTTADGQRLEVRCEDQAEGAGTADVLDVLVHLVGPHQQANAATAVGVLCVLRAAGWAIEPAAIEAGLTAARWPGRFERLGDAPPVIVDGAHNPHAAAALVAGLDERYPGRRRIFVLGASCDKDVRAILARLLPGAAGVIVTRSEHPRAMPGAELAAAVAAFGLASEVAASPGEALERALAAAAPDGLVVATGSIFLVADVREAWAARGGMPMPDRDPPPGSGVGDVSPAAIAG